MSRKSMLKLSSLSFFYILLVEVYSQTGFISFINYCNNGSDPDILPTSGKHSSGTFSMSKESILSRFFDSYEPGMNCSVTITVPKGFQLFVSFFHVSLRNSSFDNLIVYSGDLELGRLNGQQKCEFENCTHLKFESGKQINNLTFHFTSANTSVPINFTGFKAIYTVFDTTFGRKGRCKGDSRFLCLNSHCIDRELVCNGHNNCGDRSDENICVIPTKDTVWAIVVITVAVISVIIFVPIFCFLASHGTKSIVTSITVPSHAVPLYSAVDNERTNLMHSSSGRTYTDYYSSRSFEQPEPHNYGGIENRPTTSRYDHGDNGSASVS